MSLNKEMLDILRCPKCKGELEYKEEVPALDCPACSLRFAVEGDIPNFLLEQATELKNDE